MIDAEKLGEAFASGGIYALQLEVGSACDQGCIYCYMNAIPRNQPSMADATVTGILHDAARLGITAIEWLGGEPLLHPCIFKFMATASRLGLRNNLWTGGIPLGREDVARACARWCRGGLISVHVSSVDPGTYQGLHPGRPAGDLDAILRGVRHVLAAGFPPSRMLNSITLTGLQDAEDALHVIEHFEETFSIATSVNVYHTYLRPGTGPGELAKFVPDPVIVAKVLARCAAQQGVKQLPMNCVNKQYCSATVAVLHDGSVTPCATIREAGAPRVGIDGSLAGIIARHRDHLTFAAFKDPANLPSGCTSCSLSDSCWGCRSRAFAAGRGILGKDPRCFRSA